MCPHTCGEHRVSPQMFCPPGVLSVFWECFQYTVLGVNAFTDGNAVDAKTNATVNTIATNPHLICWLDIG